MTSMVYIHKREVFDRVYMPRAEGRVQYRAPAEISEILSQEYKAAKYVADSAGLVPPQLAVLLTRRAVCGELTRAISTQIGARNS